MRILGIDPGIARTGWGVIEVQSGTLRRGSEHEFKVESFGCVETEMGITIEQRLLILHEELSTIITTYHPEAMAVEELFFSNNAKTAMVVGQARGVVLLTAAENNLEVTSYTPPQVKVAVTGYGKAEKSQVGQMIKMILHLESIPKPDDVADALAVGLTHALSYKMNQR